MIPDLQNVEAYSKLVTHLHPDYANIDSGVVHAVELDPSVEVTMSEAKAKLFPSDTEGHIWRAEVCPLCHPGLSSLEADTLGLHIKWVGAVSTSVSSISLPSLFLS